MFQFSLMFFSNVHFYGLTLNLVNISRWLAHIHSNTATCQRKWSQSELGLGGWDVRLGSGRQTCRMGKKIPQFSITLLLSLLLIMPTNNTSNNVGNQRSNEQFNILSFTHDWDVYSMAFIHVYYSQQYQFGYELYHCLWVTDQYTHDFWWSFQAVGHDF